MLKSWEELSELEQAQCTFWDMYKDAYGVRPRGVDTSFWTLEQFQDEFVILGQAIAREETARKEAEAKAVVRFEKQLASMMQDGAQTRQQALKWVHDAEGSDGDESYLEYLLGLPYGYFKKTTI